MSMHVRALPSTTIEVSTVPVPWAVGFAHLGRDSAEPAPARAHAPSSFDDALEGTDAISRLTAGIHSVAPASKSKNAAENHTSRK